VKYVKETKRNKNGYSEDTRLQYGECKPATVAESLSLFSPLSAGEFRYVTSVYAGDSFFHIHSCTLFIILPFLRLSYTSAVTAVI
jgi:hypothetical protein